MHLLRPMDVLRESAILPERIKEAIPIISQSVPPFATLIERVEKDYGSFGLSNPEDYENTNNAKISLLKQLKIIEWYAEKEQIIQALSLAREWLPSLLCYHFKIDPQVHKPNREEMDRLLTGGKNKEGKESCYREEFNKLENKKTTQLRRLWNTLANLRNDALHAGFRKNPKKATEIIKETQKIIEELKAIAKAWDLTDEEN